VRMRMMLYIVVSITLGLKGTFALAAEVSSDRLVLGDVVGEALSQNPEMQAARHRWRAAQERAPQAAALDDPEFKIELFNYPERLNPDASANTIFGLSQRFSFPGKRTLKRSLAVKEAEIAAAQIQTKEQEITAQVKVLYYELLLAHKAIEVHHQQIDLLKEFFEIANGRFRAGKGAQVDVMKSSVELSKLSNDLPVLEQQLQSAKAKLNLLMNRLPQAPLGLPVEPAAEPGGKQTLETLQEMALQSRPELRVLTIETAKTQTATALAQKQTYPDFNVMVERFQNFGARDGFGGMVSMSLPFSFWTKPKYDAAVREAKANLESAKAAYQMQENQVRFEVRDITAKIEAAEKLITLYKTTVIPQAQQTLESARIGYKAAKVEFLTLLDAERALKDFRLDYYRAVTMLGQRMAELERAVGMAHREGS
jgi:outer membrane protein, heavy metal efflux system